MKIKLLVVGKTDEEFLKTGIAKYEKRMKHYISFEIITIPDIKKSKNLTEEQRREQEGQIICNKISNQDFVVLLDENGKEFNSVGFASFIEQKMITATKTVIFVIGGAYGFSKDVYQLAKNSGSKIALSKMTFSHQLVRLIFMEQLYRSMTIIRGEPYHHI